MRTILLSIKREYCQLIFKGLKRVEYRRNFPDKDIDKILVYESRGCRKVIGELIVERIISKSLDTLWEDTYDIGGIDRTLFDGYFAGKEHGIGIIIKNSILYPVPLELSSLGITSAPQNFIYLHT